MVAPYQNPVKVYILVIHLISKPYLLEVAKQILACYLLLGFTTTAAWYDGASLHNTDRSERHLAGSRHTNYESTRLLGFLDLSRNLTSSFKKFSLVHEASCFKRQKSCL